MICVSQDTLESAHTYARSSHPSGHALERSPHVRHLPVHRAASSSSATIFNEVHVSQYTLESAHTYARSSQPSAEKQQVTSKQYHMCITANVVKSLLWRLECDVRRKEESRGAAASSVATKESRVIGKDFDTSMEEFSIDRVTVGKMIASHVETAAALKTQRNKPGAPGVRRAVYTPQAPRAVPYEQMMRMARPMPSNKSMRTGGRITRMERGTFERHVLRNSFMGAASTRTGARAVPPSKHQRRYEDGDEYAHERELFTHNRDAYASGHRHPAHGKHDYRQNHFERQDRHDVHGTHAGKRRY